MSSYRHRGRGRPQNTTSHVQTPRRPITQQQQLQLLSSPSRSDGPPKAGEASLLNIATQNEYRTFIQGKIDAFVKRFPESTDPTRSRTDQEVELGQNILILFRKLREGVIASKRLDVFAVELYETSACWSILLRDGAQSTSILSQLPELLLNYHALTTTQPSQPSASPRPSSDRWAWKSEMVVIYFLHLLRNKWPSQTEFLAALSTRPQRRTGSEPSRSIFPTHTSEDDTFVGEIRAYLTSLATSIRRANYFALATLLDPKGNEFLGSLILARFTSSQDDEHIVKLRADTLLLSVNYLRELARDEIAWKCMHSAYREVSMREDARSWLSQRLFFTDGEDGKMAVDTWMEKRVEKGDLTKKEAIQAPGTSGSWLMRRAAVVTPAR
ncbi:hypothetical protein FRB94_006007 [Tulasnella sp. JGI-2019a]|nr:hypothetical protein FRB93_006420 [Tulasnella sp. JGI-2019a]KAG8999665.1 hypothetical protein FRB94_006007 [Tulasnella sp. JGI-2019a]